MKSSILLRPLLGWVFLILILFAETANAKYVQTSKIKYETEIGWSKYYTVYVTFISGYELNQATQSFKYNGFATYAVIFWEENQATVIKISSFTGCGQEVDQTCIQDKIVNLKGEDQEGRTWQICTKSLCF